MVAMTLCRTKANNKGLGDLPAVHLAQTLHGLGGAIDRDGYHSTMEGAQGKRWSILKKTPVFFNAFSKAMHHFLTAIRTHYVKLKRLKRNWKLYL